MKSTILVLAVLAFLPIMRAQDTPAKPKPADGPSKQPGTRPRLELRSGENYFRVDGRPAFVLGRNPVGMSPKAYDDHFRHAAAAGERFMRIHFTFMPARREGR